MSKLTDALGYKEQADETQNSMTKSYEDISGNKEEFKPNPEDLQNTGSGAAAAVGTEYSWEKDSQKAAQNQYKQDVLAKKQELLNNRQTIENNAVNYQAQADMMKYQNSQNAEKVGWTGGYVLDQNRQMDYLKQSIQSQMYGAMELQKYGYDSALSAARLSYDLNQMEYAKQYYQEAITSALNEAQLTGVYFSAETKDMMSQYAVAEEKLKENPDDTSAKNIQDSIVNWFKDNGISANGVKLLSTWVQEQENELSWSNELWQRYSSAISATEQNIKDSVSSFIMLDENGHEVWDGVNVKVIDFASETIEVATNYAMTCSDAKSQLYSYFNWLMNDALNQYKNKVKKTDKNGNVTYEVNQDDLNKAMSVPLNKIKEYIGFSDDTKSALEDYSYHSTDMYCNFDYDAKKDGIEPNVQPQSGSEDGEENNWDVTKTHIGYNSSTEMSDVYWYDSDSNENQEATPSGQHKWLGILLDRTLNYDFTPKNSFWDLETTYGNHLYVYADSDGRLYNLKKDEFDKYAKTYYRFGTGKDSSSSTVYLYNDGPASIPLCYVNKVEGSKATSIIEIIQGIPREIS